MGGRVAIVGAGIAGCTAAWALDRAGFEVALFEARGELGGNAKTCDWRLDEGRSVTVGLSVLAWPPELFRNYRRLLAALEIETEAVELRMLIRSGAERFIPGQAGGLARRYAGDRARWRRMLAFVRGINRVFNRSSPDASLYHFAPLNPLNVVPLGTLARRFGISRGFWAEICVPLYSSTFLTTQLDRLPAVILPTIADIMPIDAPAVLETWRGSSRAVFERLTCDFGERVHLNRAITRIEPRLGAGGEVELEDERGEVRRFDAAVLACSARAIERALTRPRRLHRWALAGFRYADEADETFAEGLVHGDPTVIPEADRNLALAEHCNYVEVISSESSFRYENHFVLSSWLPAARGSRTPMLVTYNGSRAPDPNHQKMIVDNRGAHPELCAGNLARTLLYRRLQGVDGLYYCGSYATPGNGHDLSALSGLVVAGLLGAPYPFATDAGARADFERLERIMLGRRRRAGWRRARRAD